MATKFMNIAVKFKDTLDWGTVSLGTHDCKAVPFDGQNQQIVNFAPSALYLLAAPSTPDSARERIIQRADAGERIAYTDAKTTVQAHKEVERDYPPPAIEPEPVVWQPEPGTRVPGGVVQMAVF